jgi:hypothetical protein
MLLAQGRRANVGKYRSRCEEETDYVSTGDSALSEALAIA